MAAAKLNTLHMDFADRASVRRVPPGAYRLSIGDGPDACTDTTLSDPPKMLPK